ncbi:hypothetical protein RAS1_16100 [Phycisphaerae bacterium RAS1]|nr:hypothetical protein RAS1_16100 [Phycisphaerae bacterium RAS1]
MRLHWWAALVLGLARNVLAQSLPGYELIQVTSDPAFQRAPTINNLGQVVFATVLDPYDANTAEIFLYDHGVLTQLTNDSVEDQFPHINDLGTIVWHRAIGPGGTTEIVMLRDGQLTQLTSDAYKDQSPRLNNLDHVAWYQWIGSGCGAAESNICFFDGATTQVISATGLSNQRACINDLDEIAWTEFNFCDSPWTSKVKLYRGGATIEVTTYQYEANIVDFNNAGQIVIPHVVPPFYYHVIDLWQAGATTRLTDWGAAARINDQGDVFFDRWHDDTSDWQVWLYLDGQFSQISNDPFWNFVNDINERGELAWNSGDPFWTDVRILQRMPVGDMNCDGIVDILDVNSFVLALGDPGVYEQQYPDCLIELADANGDGQVNILDINPFVQLISGQ